MSLQTQAGALVNLPATVLCQECSYMSIQDLILNCLLISATAYSSSLRFNPARILKRPFSVYLRHFLILLPDLYLYTQGMESKDLTGWTHLRSRSMSGTNPRLPLSMQ